MAKIKVEIVELSESEGMGMRQREYLYIAIIHIAIIREVASICRFSNENLIANFIIKNVCCYIFITRAAKIFCGFLCLQVERLLG